VARLPHLPQNGRSGWIGAEQEGHLRVMGVPTGDWTRVPGEPEESRGEFGDLALMTGGTLRGPRAAPAPVATQRRMDRLGADHGSP
jgi:hypothetical protein